MSVSLASARFWGLTLAFALLIQLVGAGAYAAGAMDVPVTEQPKCHELTAEYSIPIDTANNDHTCCEGGCSMMGCHSSSAVPSTAGLIEQTITPIQFALYTPTRLLRRSSSLFRPPILG